MFSGATDSKQPRPYRNHRITLTLRYAPADQAISALVKRELPRFAKMVSCARARAHLKATPRCAFCNGTVTGWRLVLVAEAVTQKERGPVCLGDRASHRVRPSRRPCLTVTYTPAVVESKLGSIERNFLGVAPVTQKPPDG